MGGSHHHHVEKHFMSSEYVRDVVIGMSDGLTVPFALAAGLSGAVDAMDVIITAGLAEVAAGSIAMGLGGYLAARTDMEHYQSERLNEKRETIEVPEREEQEVAEIFRGYGLEEPQIKDIVATIRKDRELWVDFMMKFELGIEKPNPKRAVRSAATIAASYILGGMIPLAPYFLFDNVKQALNLSIALTLVALMVFGYVKGQLTSPKPIRVALQTVAVGSLAAGAAYAIAKFIGG